MTEFYRVNAYRIVPNVPSHENEEYKNVSQLELDEIFQQHRFQYGKYLCGEGEGHFLFDLFDRYGILNCRIELVNTYDFKKPSEEEKKDARKLYLNEKFECPCFGRYTRQNKLTHLKSIKHQTYLKSIQNQNVGEICQPIL